MKTYIIISAVLAILAGIGSAYVAGRTHGANSCQNKFLKTENKEVRHEAQSFGNRTRTRDDRVRRVCEWRGIQLKDQGKPVAGLPAQSCPRNQ